MVHQESAYEGMYGEVLVKWNVWEQRVVYFDRYHRRREQLYNPNEITQKDGEIAGLTLRPSVWFRVDQQRQLEQCFKQMTLNAHDEFYRYVWNLLKRRRTEKHIAGIITDMLFCKSPPKKHEPRNHNGLRLRRGGNGRDAYIRRGLAGLSPSMMAQSMVGSRRRRRKQRSV